jgi:hypothetical protein
MANATTERCLACEVAEGRHRGALPRLRGRGEQGCRCGLIFDRLALPRAMEVLGTLQSTDSHKDGLYECSLFTTASQARQRSTSPQPFTFHPFDALNACSGQAFHVSPFTFSFPSGCSAAFGRSQAKSSGRGVARCRSDSNSSSIVFTRLRISPIKSFSSVP